MKKTLLLTFLIISSIASKAYALDVNYIANKIIMAESSGNPLAVGDNGASRGLMQISKGKWQTYTKESWERAFNAEINKQVGTSILRDIIRKYGTKATLSKVIFTYNSGIYIKHSLPAKWSIYHPNKIYRSLYLADIKNNIIDYKN